MRYKRKQSKTKKTKSVHYVHYQVSVVAVHSLWQKLKHARGGRQQQKQRPSIRIREAFCGRHEANNISSKILSQRESRKAAAEKVQHKPHKRLLRQHK